MKRLLLSFLAVPVLHASNISPELFSTDIANLLLGQRILFPYITSEVGNRLLLVNKILYNQSATMRKEAIDSLRSRKLSIIIDEDVQVMVKATLIDGMGQHALSYVCNELGTVAYIVLYRMDTGMILKNKQLMSDFAKPTYCATNAQHTCFCIAYKDYFVISDWSYRVKKRMDAVSYIPKQHNTCMRSIECTKSIRSAWPIVGAHVVQDGRKQYTIHDDGTIYHCEGKIERWRNFSEQCAVTEYSIVSW